MLIVSRPNANISPRMTNSPSSGREQFADGVVWAHCVELLREAQVLLVTADKAFFKDHDVRRGSLPTFSRKLVATTTRLPPMAISKN